MRPETLARLFEPAPHPRVYLFCPASFLGGGSGGSGGGGLGMPGDQRPGRCPFPGAPLSHREAREEGPLCPLPNGSTHGIEPPHTSPVHQVRNFHQPENMYGGICLGVTTPPPHFKEIDWFLGSGGPSPRALSPLEGGVVAQNGGKVTDAEGARIFYLPPCQCKCKRKLKVTHPGGGIDKLILKLGQKRSS